MKNKFYRVAGLVTVMLLSGLTVLPARATKVADGTVNFTGEMLGATTCTLENNSLAVDFGTINVDRNGAVPANPLTPVKPVAFRFTGCATTIQKVNMTVSFNEYPYGDDSLIMNAGGAMNVAGVLVCPANARMQGVDCTPGAHIHSGSVVHGVVSNREVSFPLEVSLVSFNAFDPSYPDIPDAGDINMTVNFTFEEE
ncbi:type 1 fimbrial protein [Salmonella enterica]|nr:type 1 fimbrial protein [Salmonella enterica]